MSDLPLIAERYQLVERLGAGGMGEVWKAQDTKFESRYVALKILKDDETHRQDAENRTKLQRSIRQEAQRGPLTVEVAEGLLDEVLRAGKGLDLLRTRVTEKADWRGHVTPDALVALFDELVGNPTCCENARTRARLRKLFKDEANAVANLRHDNIVGISDYGEFKGQPFLTMSYIEGQTLARIIQRRVPLTRQRQLELMEDLCSGLAYAHAQKLVHRDIKPANLIVDDVTGRLKILDFGVVRRLQAQSESTVGVAIGTLCYMSPEQIRGTPVDHRSDIFSVGDVFYELLTRRMAFPAGEGGLEMVDLMQRIQSSPPTPIRSLLPDIEPDIETILDKALQKNPDDRYQSLVDMQRDLARVRSDLEDQNRTVRVRTTGADAERKIREAEAALNGADGTRALELLNEALASDPTNSEAARLRILAHSVIREQEAQASAAKALADQIAGLVAEGAALLAANRPSEALAKAREAIALNRTDGAALDLSRRANAELRRLAEERARQEEAARAAEEARRAEERRLAEEEQKRRLAAEAEERRRADEERSRQEAAARAEQVREAEKRRRTEEEQKQREAAAKAEENRRQQAAAEALHKEQEAARREAEQRQADEDRRRRELEAQAEKERQAKEAAARAERARLAEEQRRQEAAERANKAATFVEAANAARARRDFAGAVHALEAAAVLTPDDSSVTKQLGEDRETVVRLAAEARHRDALEAAVAELRVRLEREDITAARSALARVRDLDATNTHLAELETAIGALETRLEARARDEAAARAIRRREAIEKWKRRWPMMAAVVVLAAVVPTAVFLWQRPHPSPATAEHVTAPPERGPAPVISSPVTVDVRPWARVKITGLGSAITPAAADPYVTPFVVSLAPGKYQLDCENGGLTSPMKFEIDVEAGQPLRVSQTMTGFDPDRIINALLGPGKQ